MNTEIFKKICSKMKKILIRKAADLAKMYSDIKVNWQK
jgi:hypothetical protein